MSLKAMVLFEGLAFVVLAVTSVILTKFVYIFEVETTLAIAVAGCFGLHVLLGPAFLFLFLKAMPDKETAKQMVSPLVRNCLSLKSSRF